MLYAKILLGMPIEWPFDYSIPSYLEDKAQRGRRAWVPFRNEKKVGYIISTSTKTNIKNIKPVYDIIDDSPILNEEMFKLTKEISSYYFCSWGEAIEAALPDSLRRGKKITNLKAMCIGRYKRQKAEALLLQDLTGIRRWEVYWQEIEKTLCANKGVIFLSPEIELAVEVRDIIQDKLKREVALLHSKQANKENMAGWLKIKNNQMKIVVGTRLAIFAPMDNLGLIIIDNENSPSYKQDQTPHYNAREVAFMRSEISGANLILASISPALETLYLARKNKIKFRIIEKQDFPQIKIVDMRKELYSKVKRTIFSYPLQYTLNQALQSNRKALIFLNRKGFATFASCRSCRMVLRCPRCNINLVYHFKEDRLICHYCNYNMIPPQICPECNASYIRYSGIGEEKVESELARLYPQARTLRLDKSKDLNLEVADIITSTSSIFRQRPKDIDLIGIISLDNSLNRLDFRATEKTFFTLLSLMSLDAKIVVIQTYLSGHYCFKAILNKDINMFYEDELKFRRQLGFPPFNHIVLIKLRGTDLQRVKSKSQLLFEKFNKINKDRRVAIVSCFASSPAKLRSNYYWQILIKSVSVKNVTSFLKKGLRGFHPSGIIVTVDVDPI